ncbi:hypothetical protein SKAU_G00322790 [Synaphobranchus kaupii]|uniref:Uncharacterized protein n=1 Tax=Synaphobranchus kaupii TaxID=118154 RepID=A0A9Q1EP60_SYNKA|nr:hypothetical protein SKAU_G00322790 [Synaphobranchus kaupii]
MALLNPLRDPIFSKGKKARRLPFSVAHISQGVGRGGFKGRVQRQREVALGAGAGHTFAKIPLEECRKGKRGGLDAGVKTQSNRRRRGLRLPLRGIQSQAAARQTGGKDARRPSLAYAGK